MPNIPWFRDWFEKQFTDLCAQHDWEYDNEGCKLCSDWRFVRAISIRGYWWLTPLVFIAIQMPWVWISYNKRIKKDPH
jgi:hypothetical protein